MSERSVEYATFTIDRTYEVSPAAVFAAWATPEAKSRWFKDPDGWVTNAPYELDFRVGGHELSSGSPEGGPLIDYRAHYWDIVQDERIVYTYEMQMDGTRISVSLATVELEPKGAGTRISVTEQGAYLDGHDTPDQRQQGTGPLLDALGEVLRTDSGAA